MLKIFQRNIIEIIRMILLQKAEFYKSRNIITVENIRIQAYNTNKIVNK